MSAKIYQPARNAMQSGKGATRQWVLEFDPAGPRQTDPLMGWTSSGDTRQQLRLTFASAEEARAYAERRGIAARVIAPRRPEPIAAGSKSYSDNFRFGRSANWTH